MGGSASYLSHRICRFQNKLEKKDSVLYLYQSTLILQLHNENFVKNYYKLLYHHLTSAGTPTFPVKYIHNIGECQYVYNRTYISITVYDQGSCSYPINAILEGQ